MKTILKRIYSDFFAKNFIVVEREAGLPEISGKIHTIIGPRRSGKTYFLYQVICGLLKKGIDKSKILFLNFEDERLNFTGAASYDAIFDAFLELYPETRPDELHIFFDEIQSLPNWEKFVRRIFDSVSRNIYITGSNSAMLSKEIATSLRGRNFVTEILPLSFGEYLKFKSIDPKKRHGLGASSKINVAFDEFMAFGGYPEIIYYPPGIKVETLQNYFDIMIYRDLIERYDIARADILKHLMRKIISSAARDFSVNKTYNELKSNGYGVSKDTIYMLMDHIKNIYFCEFVEKRAGSKAIRESLNKKAYLYDNGIISALNYDISQNHGKLLENLVFIELRRRRASVFYDRNGHECDFWTVDRSGKTLAIQVVYELNGDNIDREMAGLRSARADRKILLYRYNLSGVEDERFIDIIDWLLKR